MKGGSMPTTKDLIGEYIDLEGRKEYAEGTDDVQMYDKACTDLITVKNSLRRKIDNVDHFLVEVNKRVHLVDAETEALKDEIERLKNRRRYIIATKDFFNKTLLPMVIKEVGTEEGVFETDTARYKLYQTYGPAEIDVEKLDNKYKNVKITEIIDKKAARNDAIACHKEGTEPPEGVHIELVDRVRRS